MFQLSDISGICITGLCCCERTEISLFTTGLVGVKTDEKLKKSNKKDSPLIFNWCRSLDASL